MKKRTVMSQVGSGFLLTGKVLLMMGWLFLVIAGLGEAFTPPLRPLLGWALLALAGAAFFLTMDRWVKVFPGLVALAVLNGTMEVGSGHVLNNPQVPIPRLEALTITVAFGASALLSARFRTQRLTIADRVALFVFVCCAFWPSVAPRLWLVATIGMVASLLLAWAYDAFRRAHGGHRGVPRPTTDTGMHL